LSLLSACRVEKKEPVKKEELGVKEDDDDDDEDEDDGDQEGDDSGASRDKEDADVRDFRYALENLKYLFTQNF